MTDPITFDSVTPRLSFPLLYAGQSQKEVFVNEAFALADALIHCIIEAEQSAPPAAPADGFAWLVGMAPSGEWTGKGGKIACRQQGQWIFADPKDGMRLVNRATGQDIRRVNGGWIAPAAPAGVSGGEIADSELRSAFASLVQRLREAGIFPTA